MSTKAWIKRIFERLTHTHIYRELPRGLDPFPEIAEAFPHLRVDVVFDVGANTGQSVEALRRWLPDAWIYSFEPASVSFRRLQRRLGNDPRLRVFHLALGSTVGPARLACHGSSDLFTILPAADEPPGVRPDVEEVDMQTLDSFCGAHAIDRIGYLKIDTEGWDLEVLRGGSAMLQEQRIDLVQVEAGMSVGNRRHVPFEQLKEYLEARRYFLFGIYEQVRERPTGEAHLRRSNCIFASASLIEAHRSR